MLIIALYEECLVQYVFYVAEAFYTNKLMLTVLNNCLRATCNLLIFTHSAAEVGKLLPSTATLHLVNRNLDAFRVLLCLLAYRKLDVHFSNNLYGAASPYAFYTGDVFHNSINQTYDNRDCCQNEQQL
jgi:hypothetical protein